MLLIIFKSKLAKKSEKYAWRWKMCFQMHWCLKQNDQKQFVVSLLVVLLRLSFVPCNVRRSGLLIEFALSGAFDFRRSATLISSALFSLCSAPHRADCRGSLVIAMQHTIRPTGGGGKLRWTRGRTTVNTRCGQSFSRRTFARVCFGRAFFYLCGAPA
jgi:hypothetical protein